MTSPNRKVYVGKCKAVNRTTKMPMSPEKTLEHRWRGHCSPLSGCVAIKAAIAKYGHENFKKEVLLEVRNDQLDQYEKKFIALYRSDQHKFGYNRTPGGEGGGFDLPHVREKMRMADSTWMKAQKSRRVADLKQEGLRTARAKDPSIEVRRKANAAAAMKTEAHRTKFSAIQNISQNRPETLAKRKAMLARKRDEMLSKLSPVSRERKLRKLEKQAIATAKWKAKRTANERN